jgi:quercetin dioxygenase-like cupin family protein
MKRRIIVALGALVLPAVLVVGAALATPPSGLQSQLLTRFTVPDGALTVTEGNDKLQLNFKESKDLAVVKATLAADGQTGWHRHPLDSIVVVTAGTLTVSMPAPDGKTCASEQYGQGQAFVHGKDVHNFVAGSGGAEFYVLYVAPVGAALGDFTPPAPEECS